MQDLAATFTSRQFAAAANTSYDEADGFLRFALRLGYVAHAGRAPRQPGQKGGQPLLYRFADDVRGRRMRELLHWRPSLVEELGGGG